MQLGALRNVLLGSSALPPERALDGLLALCVPTQEAGAAEGCCLLDNLLYGSSEEEWLTRQKVGVELCFNLYRRESQCSQREQDGH